MSFRALDPPKRLEDFALFGGGRMFDEPLHVGRPNVPPVNEVCRKIRGVLEHKWLTNNGPMVREFERTVADMVGVRHCIATCNATVGLQMAVRALDLSGEVIVPSFTFVATAHSVQWQGLKPVFVDIDRVTHNLDPSAVEAAITPATSGIIGVHLWGGACEIERLTAIADQHRLKLLFDAAHAFGCRHQGISVGNFGHAEVFSFHATKVVNCGEGGAIVTNDDSLAHRLRLIKNFGFAGVDRVIHMGSNGKMAEVNAVLGVEGLCHVGRFIETNRRNLAVYEQCLAGVRGVSLRVPDREHSNCHYVVAEIDQDRSGIHRDHLLAVLEAENVLARRYFFPGIHRMAPYRDLDPGLTLPVTEEVSERVLVLPTGTSMAEEDIRGVCELIRSAVDHGPAIAAAMRERVP